VEDTVSVVKTYHVNSSLMLMNGVQEIVTVFVLLPTIDRQKNQCVTLKKVKVETSTRRESESKNT
jgi:hypothetical protein